MVFLFIDFLYDGFLNGAFGYGKTESRSVHDDQADGCDPHVPAESQHIKVRPPAFFGADDDHWQIHERVEHGGDNAIKRFYEFKVFDPFEKDEREDGKNGAEEVQ